MTSNPSKPHTLLKKMLNLAFSLPAMETTLFNDGSLWARFLLNSDVLYNCKVTCLHKTYTEKATNIATVTIGF
jgi:hypothetical protein